LIFGLCVGGLCGLATLVRELSDRSRDHYVAINIAKNRIERAKTFDFDELDLLSESGVVVDVNGTPNGSGHYRRSTSVSFAATNLKEIAVQVDIRNRVTTQFGSENETTRTYIANLVGSEGE
jgi:hypothetical protein